MVDKKILGFCGVDCGECPVYIATKANDFKKKDEVSKMLFNAYNVQIKPEDINCTGCVKATLNGTAIIGHCEACELRKCAMKKNVLTCASCENYICENLRTKWDDIPNGGDAKINLEKEKTALGR
ncbi:MAG: DUF3795 domain-containing protein [Solirubrobacterales bacterium]